MPYHTPLWTHQEEVSEHAEGTEAQIRSCYPPRNKNNTHKKRQNVSFFTHQEFRDGDTPIKIYALAPWCQITTEDARHLFFSDGPVYERTETAKAEDISEEVVEIKLLVMGNDEVGL